MAAHKHELVTKKYGPGWTSPTSQYCCESCTKCGYVKVDWIEDIATGNIVRPK